MLSFVDSRARGNKRPGVSSHPTSQWQKPHAQTLSMASSPTPRPPLARSPTADVTTTPPRPSDAGVSSWSAALDLYLAEYDAFGHGAFSSVDVRPGPVVVPVLTPPVAPYPPPPRAPSAAVTNDRVDEEMRHRLNRRLTRGLHLRGGDSVSTNRSHLLGWSARPPLNNRLDVQNTNHLERYPSVYSTYRRRKNTPRRHDDLDDSNALPGWKSGEDPRRASRATRKPKPPRRSSPPFRRNENESADYSTADASQTPEASSGSPSPSPSVSQVDDTSTSDSGESGMGIPGGEKRAARDVRRRASFRLEKDGKNTPGLESPDAAAARRVDALLSGLGVALPWVDADASKDRFFHKTCATNAPAPAPAPGDSVATRRNGRDETVAPLPTFAATGVSRRPRGDARGSSVTSSVADPGTGSISDSKAEESGESGSSSSQGESQSSGSPARGVSISGTKPSFAAAKLKKRQRASKSFARKVNKPPAPFSQSQSQSRVVLSSREAETCDDVSSESVDSECSSFSAGEASASRTRREPTQNILSSSRPDPLAETVVLSLATLSAISNTHSLPVSPPDSPETAARQARREARNVRWDGTWVFPDAGEVFAASDEETFDRVVAAKGAPVSSPSGLTGAARVRAMYPDLFCVTGDGVGNKASSRSTR